MSGFDIGKLIQGVAEGGIENSFKQGIKYLQEDKKLTVWAIRTFNTEALLAIAHVDALFVKESIGLAANPSGLLGDPTAGSRHAMQAVWDKYGAQVEDYWKAHG